MGNKKKATSKTEPLTQYKPFVDASLNASQGVFNEWQPKLNQRANETLGVYDQLRPGAVSGIMGAQGLVNDTIGGKYLGGANPYLNDMAALARQNVLNDTQGAFSAAGRYGSGAFANAAAKGMADAELGLRYDNYGRERQMQSQAVEQAGGLMNGTMQTLNQGTALPWMGASNLTNNVRTATAGYNVNTETQKGGLLDTVGQVAAIGATVAPAFSEPGMKENVVPIGQRPDGLGVYQFNYRPETGLPQQPQVGVMADEAQAMRPDALGPTVGGARTVDYGKLQQDAAGLTPRVDRPGLGGAFDRVLNPDTSTTLGKIGLLGQHMLAAYGNPLGRGLLGIRQQQQNEADRQHEMAIEARRVGAMEAAAAARDAPEPESPYIWNYQGGAFRYDPRTRKTETLREPMPAPKLYATEGGYLPATEAEGRMPYRAPARAGGGGGGLTATAAAKYRADAAAAIAKGADPAKVQARLRELGVN